MPIARKVGITKDQGVLTCTAAQHNAGQYGDFQGQWVNSTGAERPMPARIGIEQVISSIAPKRIISATCKDLPAPIQPRTGHHLVSETTLPDAVGTDTTATCGFPPDQTITPQVLHWDGVSATPSPLKFNLTKAFTCTYGAWCGQDGQLRHLNSGTLPDDRTPLPGMSS